MAASTVNAIIAKFQRPYPDCDATTALELFDDTYRGILKKCEVRNNVVYITPIVAGTTQYDLSPNVYKIHEAYWEDSADPGNWHIITETNTDKLAAVSSGWRARRPIGYAWQYYVTSTTSSDSAKNQIGFVNVPNVSTSGTYPRVALYVTEYAILTGTETVPDNLLDDDVFVYGMCQKWAAESDSMRYEYWKALADDAMARNVQHVENLQNKAPDFEIITPFINCGRVY